MKKNIIILSMLFVFLFNQEVYASDDLTIAVVHEDGRVEIPRTTIPRTTLSDSEILALQQVAIAEAGNQGAEGMAYVMQTILNRVESERFPNNVIDVITQKGQFSTASYYTKYEVNEESKEAFNMLETLYNKGQLFFESNSIKNSWQSKNLYLCFTYKSHNFYITY